MYSFFFSLLLSVQKASGEKIVSKISKYHYQEVPKHLGTALCYVSFVESSVQSSTYAFTSSWTHSTTYLNRTHKYAHNRQ